ncbi:MAG: hypothetical protein F4174_08770 [Acidobacteria bacterium]|nr:hypothetical protein [Acidobacteriota bacterium]
MGKNKDQGKVTVEALERQIQEREGISVIIRARSTEMVRAYSFQRAAPKNMSVSDFKELRLSEHVGDFEAVIMDGSHRQPHGRTKLVTLRDSYYD